MDKIKSTIMQEFPWLNAVWRPRSRFFKTSLMPIYYDSYKWDICWHGCDKVSRLEDFGGGGS